MEVDVEKHYVKEHSWCPQWRRYFFLARCSLVQETVVSPLQFWALWVCTTVQKVEVS